jgi:hypothetical protein
MVNFNTILKHLNIDTSDIQWRNVINMANAITGITILAMPYCFSQVLKINNKLEYYSFLCISFYFHSVESYWAHWH